MAIGINYNAFSPDDPRQYLPPEDWYLYGYPDPVYEEIEDVTWKDAWRVSDACTSACTGAWTDACKDCVTRLTPRVTERGKACAR